MMYNIAAFLLVQLSLSRFTLIKSARTSHVCINLGQNYITSFINLIIRISDFRGPADYFRHIEMLRLIQLSAMAEGST